MPSGTEAPNWSSAGNWVGGTAPTGTVETLSFPALTAGACTSMPPTDTCAESNNDLTGLSVNHIAIDQSTDYDITGNGITLGAGGITATTSGSSTPNPQLNLPIALGAPQTWTFEGPIGGSQTAYLGGSVTGPGEALSVTLGGFQSLGLDADDEVGPLTITGANASHSGPTAELNGYVLNDRVGGHQAKLNGTDGNPVSVIDAAFAGYNDTVGPLTTNGAYVDTGAPEIPAGTLAVNGTATFDSGSVVEFIIADDTGATSGTDNSELTATGAVALGAPTISLALLGANNTTCPTLPSGSVYTLVSTSGSISGTFAGVPDGTEIQLGNVNCNGPPSQKLRINYHETGSPQTVTATVPGAGGVPKSTSPPTISGTALEGQILTEAHAAWNPSPTSYSYQWESCEASGSACSPIAGATSQTYTLTAAQVCHTIRVQETASDAAGPGTPASSADYGLVSAPESNFTWTGVGEYGHWSTPGDWSGCAAPSGTVGTLTFPAGGCTMVRVCRVEDDIAGLTASRLELPVQFTLATPGQFVITGTKVLTLTSGLTTTFQNALVGGNETFEGASIATPIALGGPNTWRIASFTSVSGGVSGASDALAIDMEPPFADNVFYLEGASNEVGSVTVSGWQEGCCDVAGWDRMNVTRDLNGIDGHSVTVNGGASLGGIAGSATLATVGPITVNPGGAVETGLAVQGALDLESGASFASHLLLGTTAASTPQITSTGKMSVSGAYLALYAECGLPPGTRFTLLEAAGGLSGTLTDALTGLPIPDGGIAETLVGCTQAPTVQINYTADTVTATVLGPPSVETGTASDVSQTHASLNGSVDPNGVAVSECRFEYGTTSAYGSLAPCEQAVAGGIAATPVTAALSGLTANTTYHFRLMAANALGTGTGQDETFTTSESEAGPGARNEGGPGIPAASCTPSSVHFSLFTAYASCFVKRGGAWIATGRVRLNGVDITPNGGHIEINPTTPSLSATGTVSVRIGTLLVYEGDLHLGLGAPFKLAVPAGTKLKGLPIVGELLLEPVTDGMKIDANATVGQTTADITSGFTGEIELHVSNSLGLELNNLKLVMNNIELVKPRRLTVEKASLTYAKTSAGDVWTGSGEVSLPYPLPGFGGTIGLTNGRLSEVGFEVSGIDKPIGTIVYLQKLGLDVRWEPDLAVTGTLGVSAGPVLPAFNAPLAELDATLGVEFSDPPALTASGELVLVGQMHLAHAEAKWTVPDRFEISGEASFSVGPAKARLKGSGGVTNQGFGLFAEGEVSVPAVTAQGLGYISEKGITACASVSAGPTTVFGGFGYYWGGSLELWADSCEMLNFKTAAHLSAATVAPVSFEVPRGQSQTVIGARAEGGYPSFTLRSPAGQAITRSGGEQGAVGSGGYRWVTDPTKNGTYVLLGRPEAGTWTLTPAAESPRIDWTASALSAPLVRVKSTVRRRGSQDLLSWSSATVPGQTLRFLEVGERTDDVILTTSKARGQIRFNPTDTGHGEERHIQIEVAMNDLPRKVLKGPAFAVAAPTRPHPPSHVSIVRRGSRATISWSPARRAALYLVEVRASDGRHLLFRSSAKHRSLTLPHVIAPLRLSVSISTVASDALRSNARIAKAHWAAIPAHSPRAHGRGKRRRT